MPGVTDKELLKAFAAELKSRRSAVGISQEELAHRAEMNRTFVAKLELAQNQPTLTSLFKLAAGLETVPADLVAAVEDRYALEKSSASRS